jgi:enamine deaminase RidA (YjgF/YER057c/UK114 family)
MTNSTTVISSDRSTVFSPSRWENQMGYARGVRVGNLVMVAGTVAADGNGVPQGSNAYEQTVFIIKKIERALNELGATLADVVCTTTHLVKFEDFDEYARAHKEFFDAVRPVNTTVAVSSLVLPELLVEVGAMAVLSEPNGKQA